MAKPRLEYDKNEVEEILDLYKDKVIAEGNILTEYKSKTISKFNEELVANNIKRENGKPFTLYKYNFWAGRQRSTNDYNYGKKIILNRNEELRLKAVGDAKNVEMQDIINIVNKNIKDPNKLTALLCTYVKKQKNKVATVLDENIKLTNENKALKDRIEILENTYLNIFFNSQIPNNSLNDMLSLSRTQDGFISEELENMFEDGLDRIRGLGNLDPTLTEGSGQYNSLQNIINIAEKKEEMERMKQLEDEGF